MTARHTLIIQVHYQCTDSQSYNNTGQSHNDFSFAPKSWWLPISIRPVIYWSNIKSQSSIPIKQLFNSGYFDNDKFWYSKKGSMYTLYVFYLKYIYIWSDNTFRVWWPYAGILLVLLEEVFSFNEHHVTAYHKASELDALLIYFLGIPRIPLYVLPVASQKSDFPIKQHTLTMINCKK